MSARADVVTNNGVAWSYTVANGFATLNGAEKVKWDSDEECWTNTPIAGNVSIPSSLQGHPVTRILASVFGNKTGLTGVTVPNSVTNIYACAFSNCTALARVSLGNGISTIRDGTFYGCRKLASVNIPGSVTNIGKLVFADCHALTSLRIPDSVKRIDEWAIGECSSLRIVYIGSGTAFIHYLMWTGCSSLTTIQVAEENQHYASRDGVLFSKDLKELIVCPEGKSGAYEVPAGTTDIGYEAFLYCRRLKSMSIPSTVTSIGGYAFMGSGLETLYVPGAWQTKYVDGQFWEEDTGVPEGCRVVYEGEAKVENVRAWQREKTTLVDVYYDLAEGDPEETCTVSLSMASPGGAAAVASTSGAIGGGVVQGQMHHIVWDAGADWPDREEVGVVATVTAPGGSAESEPFALDTRKPVVIQDVESDYCSGEYGMNGRKATFLHGVECPVEFRIRAETHRGAEVDYYLVNGTRQDGATFTFDVGNVLPGRRLKIHAVDKEGNRSSPFSANFDTAVMPPLWNVAGQPSAWVSAHPQAGEGRVLYRASAYRGLSLFEALSDVAEIAGEEFPLDFFPTMQLYQTVDSGTGQYREGADMGVKHDPAGASCRFGQLGGLEITLGLTGGTLYGYDPIRQTWFQTSRDLGLQLGGAWRIRQRLPQFPLLYGEIGMVASGEFLAREREGLWECDIALDPLVALQATLGLGADVIAAAEVTGQGGVVLDARVPGGLDYVGLQGKFEWRAVLFGFERSGIWWEADYPIYGSRGASRGVCSRVARTGREEDGGFRPIGRNYGRGIRRRTAAKAEEATPVVLAEDGYPAPQPSLAANGDRDALVYVRDNGGRGDLDRTEVVFRSGMSGQWSEEEAVWDDGTADFMPKVALLADGTVLAAWANEGRELGEGAAFGEACAALEIAVGVRDASTGLWDCRNLTDDAALDCVPMLKAAEDGTAAVAWVRNADGEYMGSAESPSDLCAAFRRNGKWGAVAVAVAQAGAVLTHDLAWDGERAALVWAVDADGNLATGGDTEIRAALFEDGAWETPVRLSGAASGAMSPHVWFLNDGTLHAIWTEDGTLFAANGLSEGCGVAVAGAETVSVPPGYRLLSATATNAVLAWTETPPEGSGRLAGDVVAVSYSPESGIPGGTATLLATEDWERNMSGAVGSDGTLRLAYESVTVEADGEGILGYGAVDLAVYRTMSGSDVKASPVGCSFAEALAVGETNRLVVKVENAGPVEADGVVWQIWDGTDPVAAGLVDVPPFSSVPVSAAWTPEEGLTEIEFIVEVGTNTFVWRPDTGRPALSFRDAQAVKATETLRLLSARLHNDGVAPFAAGAVAEFRRGDADGELIGTDTLGAVGCGDVGEYSTGIAWDMAGKTFTSAWERVTIALPGAPGAPNVSVWAATPLDTDGDGLPDAEEEALGTDPAKPDTNGDGISDYDHVYVWFTDPLAGMDGEWTAETPVPVPHEWLTGFGLGGGTPEGCEKAAAAPAANGVNAVWECYVAGIDPTDASAKFEAELVFEDGQWKAKPKGGEKEGRTYRVKGKREMSDVEEWTDVTDVENAEADGWRFFRVGVGME